MVMAGSYVPDAGEIVWVSFNNNRVLPQAFSLEQDGAKSGLPSMS